MVKDLLKAVDSQVRETYTAQYLELLEMKVKERLVSSVVVEDLYNRVMDKMSSLGFQGNDPTNPERWRSEIRAEVERNLGLARSTVSAVGGSLTLTVTLLSEEFVGVDTGGPTDNTDPTPMRWLYYYLYGDLEKDLFWLPAEHLRDGDTYLGRFDEGYLIDRERATKINNSRGNVATQYNLGDPNPDLFQSILSQELIMALIVNPAVQDAVQQFRPK